MLPSFHDANLISFNWSEDNVGVELSFQNKTVVIELSGVTRLLVNGLREGNIVRETFLFDARNVSGNLQTSREWVEYLVRGARLDRDSPTYEAWNKSVQVIFKDIETGKASLFCIAQSYGCEMACLCKAIKLSGAEGLGEPGS